MKKLVLQVQIKDEKAEAEDISKASIFSYVKDIYNTSKELAEKYAKRCGADYYAISELNEWEPIAGWHPTYQKLKLYDLLQYDQILYIDSDYIIKESAPDIFEQYGPISAVCLEQFAAENADKIGIPHDKYFNAGMLYLNKKDIIATKTPLLEMLSIGEASANQKFKYLDQCLLNKLFFETSIELTYLDGDLWNPYLYAFGEYADHYAGDGKRKWDPSRYL